MVADNPKTVWFKPFITPYTIVITTEDLDFWKEQKVKVVSTSDEDFLISDDTTVILAEMLQKQEDPVKILHMMKRDVIVVVPNEWSWAEQNAPFKNANHKWLYDADMLAEHLEAAGYTYVLGLIEFNGWSFLTAQGTRE